MAEAEYAGMGAFLESLSSTWKGQRREQKRKHDQWMSCIMGGISAEDCTRILGYDPGEEARGGAESMEAGRRQAQLKKEGEEYSSIPIEKVRESGMPLSEVDWTKATIRPGGTTIPVKREEIKFFRSLQSKTEGALTPSQRMNEMKLGLLQKLQKGEEWNEKDVRVAKHFWPDKITTGAGLSPSQQISQLKLGLLQKTKEGEEWTEDEQDLARYMGLEKEAKSDLTLGRILPPDINMFGDFIPPGPEFNMYRIKQAERLGIKTNNKATMEEARKARIMKGYPPLEDEIDLKKAIKDGDFGKTEEEILASLKTMDYPDDYIEFIVEELGIK